MDLCDGLDRIEMDDPTFVGLLEGHKGAVYTGIKGEGGVVGKGLPSDFRAG